MKLKGRKALVTGGSVGLGKAITETFLSEGADVVFCGRDSKAVNLAEQELQAKRLEGQKVIGLTCDVSQEESVKALFQETVKSLGGVDILVNNAGIYGPKGPSEQVSATDWWQTLEINLKGVFLTTQLAVPLFKEQKMGAILNLSGGGATAPLPFFSAYAASKAAVVRFTETMAEELRGTGITVNALAPGALNTRMLDEVLSAGPSTVGANAYERAMRQRDKGGASMERAAELCVYLVCSPGITGKLVSAPWDPWPLSLDQQVDIAASDVYTLRRIVPKDRGMTWGREDA